MSMLMCTQKLVQFCQFILKISSGHEILTLTLGHNSKFYHLVFTILVVTETSNHITMERQGESSIAPLFQSGAILMTRFTIEVFFFASLCSFISQETNKHSYSSRVNGQFLCYVHPIFVKNTMCKIARSVHHCLCQT